MKLRLRFCDLSWALGRRVKNRGFDLSQGQIENAGGPSIFSGRDSLVATFSVGQPPQPFWQDPPEPCVPSVFHQWTREVELQPIVWQVTHVCLSACMFECMYVWAHVTENGSVEAKTCDGDLRPGIAAKTGGEDLRQRLAARKLGEDLRQKTSVNNRATKSPKTFGEELREEICEDLDEAKLQSKNSSPKIPGFLRWTVWRC